MVEEVTSIVLDGLEEVLELQPCSMVMPSNAELDEGRSLSLLTHYLSGVAAVIRVGLLSSVDNEELASGSLAGMMHELQTVGRVMVWCCSMGLEYVPDGVGWHVWCHVQVDWSLYAQGSGGCWRMDRR